MYPNHPKFTAILVHLVTNGKVIRQGVLFAPYQKKTSKKCVPVGIAYNFSNEDKKLAFTTVA